VEKYEVKNFNEWTFNYSAGQWEMPPPFLGSLIAGVKRDDARR
jgi:hypothetical protein